MQQRWTRWTTDRPLLLDAVLLGSAAVLEVFLELHDSSSANAAAAAAVWGEEPRIPD